MAYLQISGGILKAGVYIHVNHELLIEEIESAMCGLLHVRCALLCT